MHPFSTLWKYQENLQLFDIFSGVRKGALGTNGLISIGGDFSTIVNFSTTETESD